MGYFKTSKKEVTTSEEDEGVIPISNDEDFNLLTKLYKIQSPSAKEWGMISFIQRRFRFTRKISCKRDEIGNILITKGELSKDEYYPCIVAHMDTVHDFEANISIDTEQLADNITKVYATTTDSKGNWYMGGCGDDKNGVWLALLLLEKFDKIKIILTIEEEVSCIGAKNIDQSFLKDIGYYIEGDRKGSGDLITKYFTDSMISDEFKAIMTDVGLRYKYKEAKGVYTDICQLYSMNKASAINISVGYYDAHRSTEYTIYEELVNAKNFAKELIETLGNKKYAVEKKKYVPKTTYPKSIGYYNNNYNFTEEDYDNDDIKEGMKNVIDESKSQFGASNCENHEDEYHQQLIDIDCKVCNPVIGKALRYCGCGNTMMERKYSYFCEVCGNHKIELYAY